MAGYDIIDHSAKPRTANTPNTGRSDDWFTPPHIIEALGPFDLDPATSAVRPFDTAAKHYTITDDGLSRPWEGFVWLNPPYSDLAPWMKRLGEHYNGIALVFARTETAWFRAHVWGRASALLFLHKRVGFVRAGGDNRNPGGGPGGASPSVLVGYGPEAKERLYRSDLMGWYMDRWEATDPVGLFALSSEPEGLIDPLRGRDPRTLCHCRCGRVSELHNDFPVIRYGAVHRWDSPCFPDPVRSTGKQDGDA